MDFTLQVEFIKPYKDSLCRKSYIFLAFLFWKKLSAVTLHNWKVQSFLKANLTWLTIAKTLICCKTTNLRTFLDDLNEFKICSFSLFNTMIVKSSLRNFCLRQISSSPSALFPLLQYPAGQESFTPTSLLHWKNSQGKVSKFFQLS